MRKFYLSIVFLSNALLVFGQQVAWQKDFPISSQDFLSGVTVTLDRQYLISGSTISTFGDENPSYNFHLIKLNQQGRPVWEKYYGGDQHDYLSTTIATQEGGFLIAGTSYSSFGKGKTMQNIGGADAWVIKFSENGVEEWQASVGTPYNEEVSSAIQTTDLSYFVGGNVELQDKGFGSKDVWVLKLTPKGAIISQTVLGGIGLDEIEQMIPTKDGGCLVAVYSRSGDCTGLQKEIKSNYEHLINAELGQKDKNNSKETAADFFKIPTLLYAKTTENYGEGDYWVVKLNKAGEVEWQKSFGGKDDDRIKNIVSTDSGYLIAGESRSDNTGNKTTKIKEGTDLWLVALDSYGNEQWQKSFSFGKRDVSMSLNALWNAEHTKAKGFLLGGYTQAEEKADSKAETFWMLYLDDKGQEVWHKYISGTSKRSQERLKQALFSTEGAYILAGTSAEELGKENWKIVKLEDTQIKELIEKQDLKVYPNPVGDYCYVDIGLDFKEAEISIYDMSGKQIQKIKTINSIHKLDTHALPQGVYLLNVKTENNNLNTKMIKL
ncbi:T9SS type A sorting domain-containing protein [Riemerella anatipestifer]|nr:T9SS type A sorting domain-containing protein [Riemerella anatipestifer]